MLTPYLPVKQDKSQQKEQIQYWPQLRGDPPAANDIPGMKEIYSSAGSITRHMEQVCQRAPKAHTVEPFTMGKKKRDYAGKDEAGHKQPGVGIGVVTCPYAQVRIQDVWQHPGYPYGNPTFHLVPVFQSGDMSQFTELLYDHRKQRMCDDVHVYFSLPAVFSIG
jgi:hypothetical protein